MTILFLQFPLIKLNGLWHGMFLRTAINVNSNIRGMLWRLSLVRCLARKKTYLWGAPSVSRLVLPSSYSRGGNLLGSRDPDNTARVPVLLAIIHRDNSATCNEQPGLCVGAEAMGPVLIWDKDRLLISGPEPLALCLDFRCATNATDRMLRLRRRKTEGTMTLWINRTGVLVSRSQKLIIFTKQRYKRDGGEGDGNKIKSLRPTSYCLSHLNHRCEHLFQSPPALKLFPESSLTL